MEKDQLALQIQSFITNKESKLNLKQAMQFIFNFCPNLSHEDSQKIQDKFDLIGPIDMDEVLKKTDFDISFDENQYQIVYI